MPPKPARKGKARAKKQAQKVQRGGLLPIPTPQSNDLVNLSQVRSLQLVQPNKPYPMEGAPAFPPDFLTDDSCVIL